MLERIYKAGLTRSRRLSRKITRTLARIRGRPDWSMPIRGFGSVRVRTNSTDEWVFLDILVRRQYDLSGFAQENRISAEYNNILSEGRLPVIIDAGANVGAASIWFATRYPKARILAVEPDPGNAAMCRLNTEMFPSVTMVEAAIGSRPGRVSLKSDHHGEWAIQTVRSDAEEGGIGVRTIPDLVSGEGPSAQLFIVKIDIEGFERDLFQTNLGWIDEAAAIIVEPHDWMLPGKRTTINLQRAMAQREFELLVSGENLVYVRLTGINKRNSTEQSTRFSDEYMT